MNPAVLIQRVFKYFRPPQPELPNRRELKHLVAKYIQPVGSSNRTYDMAGLYAYGWELEEIAQKYNVTNERIRQCIWKFHRRATHNPDKKW